MKGERKVGPKLRFEVLKRDGFTCVYCGATPPGIVLHADHVTPVSAGGTNDIDNLVTACASCNRGKGAVPLSKNAQAHTIAASLQRQREIAEIETAYNDYLRERRELAEAKVERMIALWNEDALRSEFSLTEHGRESMKYFCSQLMEEEVRNAIYIAIRKMPYPYIDHKWKTDGRKYQAAMAELTKRFRYFCGICHNKIKERGAP